MGSTQAALYEEIADDLQLSWSEAELPECERRGLMGRGGQCPWQSGGALSAQLA